MQFVQKDTFTLGNVSCKIIFFTFTITYFAFSYHLKQLFLPPKITFFLVSIHTIIFFFFWGQDAWLQWSYESWHFHRYITRRLYSFHIFLFQEINKRYSQIAFLLGEIEDPYQQRNFPPSPGLVGPHFLPQTDLPPLAMLPKMQKHLYLQPRMLPECFVPSLFYPWVPSCVTSRTTFL